jgi:hypothetical protein
MSRSLRRLLFLTAMLVTTALLPLGQHVAYADDVVCTCDYTGGSQFIAVYLSDGTFVDLVNYGQPNTHTADVQGCYTFCNNTGHARGAALCQQHGLTSSTGKMQLQYTYYTHNYTTGQDVHNFVSYNGSPFADPPNYYPIVSCP